MVKYKRKECVMKGIRRFLLFLMVAVCVIVAPASAYAAKTSGNKSGNIDTDDFAIKVVCGIEGNYKYQVQYNI